MLLKLMGFMLFIVGLLLIVLSTLVIFSILTVLGPVEKWVVFVSGTVLCVIGYVMARNQEELAVESTTPNQTVEVVSPTRLDDIIHPATAEPTHRPTNSPS